MGKLLLPRVYRIFEIFGDFMGMYRDSNGFFLLIFFLEFSWKSVRDFLGVIYPSDPTEGLMIDHRRPMMMSTMDGKRTSSGRHLQWVEFSATVCDHQRPRV